MCLTACNSSENEGNWTNCGIDEACVVIDNMAFMTYDAEEYVEDYAELVSYNEDFSYLNIPEKVHNKKTDKWYPVKFIDPYITIVNDAWGNSNIQSVKMPNTIEAISECTFMDCFNLTSVVLSENLKSIPEGAFSGCRNLSSIKIPGSVISISKGAFARCNNLTSIELSEGLEYINEEAFTEAVLTSIVIPSSVKTIKPIAFKDCGIKEITLKGTPYIGMYAFNLGVTEKIYWHATTPPFHFDASKSPFAVEYPSSIPLYVPQGSKKEYERYGWDELFINIIEME